MLASVTPLGERGRQSTWGFTAGAFLLGALGAGVAAGAILGLAGSALAGSLASHLRLGLLAAGALVALALDVLPRKVPGPHRQVDERWRERYRGWVWGGGYGIQLGLGVTTVVLSAATYLAFWAAFLSASALRGAMIGGAFGLVRGVQPLLTRGVDRPERLVAFHARLTAWRSGARITGLVLLMGVLALAAIGGLA